MTDQQTVISVRGDAQLEVAPDLATLYGRVMVVETSKAAALQRAASRLDGVLASLRNLGGVPLTAGDERRPLAWLARSSRSYPRVRWDKEHKRRVRTGRIVAEVELLIALRDFALSDSVAAALAGHERYHTEHIGWSVDHDNPGWRQVRSAAIHAAVRKARDYAVALGGAVTGLDHLADVGLLSTAADHLPEQRARSAAAFSRRATRRAAPSVNPEPQLLTAAVEARFSALVPDLREGGA